MDTTFMKTCDMHKALGLDETLTIKAGVLNDTPNVGKEISDIFYNLLDHKCYKTAIIERTDDVTVGNIMVDFELEISDGNDNLFLKNMNSGTFELHNSNKVEFDYSYTDDNNNIKTDKVIKKVPLNEPLTCNPTLFDVKKNVVFGSCGAIIGKDLKVIHIYPSSNCKVSYQDEFVL